MLKPRGTRHRIEYRSQHDPKAFSVFVPFTRLHRQAFAARAGQFVPLAAAPRGIVPLAADQLVRFQPVQQRVQRSRLNIDQPAAGVSQLLLQQVAVLGTAGQDRKHHQIETPAHQLGVEFGHREVPGVTGREAEVP
jgi:hypothetical protein